MAQGLLSAYLVVGSDELKRETAVRRLRSRVPADLADFNLDEFDAKSVEDPEALVSSLQTLPFGADFRLVIVHGAETLAKPVSEALVSYLADPNPQSVLCLEAEKLAKNTRLYKAVAKVGPKSVVDCSPLKRWELPPYVVRLASRRGLAMGTDAAEELVNRCGESTVMLDNQIATLAELVGQTGQITLADVEANVAQTAEVSPWAFADAVCERDAAKAMALLRLMKAPPPGRSSTTRHGSLALLRASRRRSSPRPPAASARSRAARTPTRPSSASSSPSAAPEGGSPRPRPRPHAARPRATQRDAKSPRRPARRRGLEVKLCDHEPT